MNRIAVDAISNWLNNFCENFFWQVQVYPGDGSSSGELALRLGVHFPESYPSASCPVAELHAPWLSENSREKLVQMFTNLYEESVGEVVVFRWVEWLKVLIHFLFFHPTILVLFLCNVESPSTIPFTHWAAQCWVQIQSRMDAILNAIQYRSGVFFLLKNLILKHYFRKCNVNVKEIQ